MKNLKLLGSHRLKKTEYLQDESETGKTAFGSKANRAVQDSCTSQYMLVHDQTFIHTVLLHKMVCKMMRAHPLNCTAIYLRKKCVLEEYPKTLI